MICQGCDLCVSGAVSHLLVVCNHHGWLHILAPPRSWPSLLLVFWPSRTFARFGSTRTRSSPFRQPFFDSAKSTFLAFSTHPAPPRAYSNLLRYYIRLKQRVNSSSGLFPTLLLFFSKITSFSFLLSSLHAF